MAAKPPDWTELERYGRGKRCAREIVERRRDSCAESAAGPTAPRAGSEPMESGAARPSWPRIANIRSPEYFRQGNPGGSRPLPHCFLRAIVHRMRVRDVLR